MAIIPSFETHCHLEAIERDLIPIVARLEADLLLNEEIMSLEFHEALKDLRNEVLLQELANELDDEIQKAIAMDLMEAIIGKEQMMLEDLRQTTKERINKHV